MKKTYPFMITLIISLSIFTNCRKDEEKPIISEDIPTNRVEYPDSGFYGQNILNLTDTIYKCDIGPEYGDGKFNSMKAILSGSTSSVRVEIKGIRIAVYNTQGWNTNFTNFKYDDYVFEAENFVSADLKIFFCDEGTATVSIYENDEISPVRTKTLTLIR